MNTDLANFSQQLAYEFAEAGIRDAFLVTGGAIAPFTSALAEQGRVKMHYMLTEQSAGIAAESYGYFDLRPALLIVTSGPGVTNAMTAIAAAWTNSSPVIVVSGQARSSDVLLSKNTSSRQVGNQHLRTDLLVESIVKNFVELETPLESRSLVKSLISKATHDRPGPVWLSIPQDIQRGPAGLVKFANSSLDQESKFDSVGFKIKMSELLKKSKSPCILLGAGSRKALPSILNFAEKFNIPILTTWPGMDLIPHDHRLFCGRPGSIPSSSLPNFVNVETDFLIVLGARLDLGQVGYNPTLFAGDAEVVRVDVDSEEFLRIPPRKNWYNFKSNIVNIIGPLDELAAEVPEIDLTLWWERITTWREKFLQPIEISQDFEDGISSYKAISLISKTFSTHTIVTGSSGTCMEMLLQSWEINDGQRIINSCGLGSMGFALSAAIGIAAKSPVGEIVCIESDGSFAMNIQDLATMKRMNTVFKLIVMDSGGYKSISLSQKRLNQAQHGNSSQTELALPQLDKVAMAMGFHARVCLDSIDLQRSVDWLKNQSFSSILVIKVSEHEEALPRLVSKPDRSGVMITPPMNQLFPEI